MPPRKQNTEDRAGLDRATPMTSGQLAEQDPAIAQAQADERERDNQRMQSLEEQEDRNRNPGGVAGLTRPEGDSGYRFPALMDSDLVDTSTKFPSAEQTSGDGGRAQTKDGAKPSENK